MRPAYRYQDSRLLAYIHHPAPTVRVREGSLCLGVATDRSERIFEIASPRPEGTFALFRSDSHAVELLSDYTASRTIWYALTPTQLIASTSQRMVIAALGDFHPDLTTYRWMLASGCLGPGRAWDTRLTPVPPSSTVMLDRATWTLRIEHAQPLTFRPAVGSAEWHEARLRNAVQRAVTELGLDPAEWTLALSGGMDSRSLLYYLHHAAELRTVTWGVRGALTAPASDAAIARTLARLCGVEHDYAETDVHADDLPAITRRFLTAGEGRIDHLHGYTDGLDLWARLSSAGRGIIRGYDAFGRKPPVRNGFQARRASSLLVSTDYSASIVPPELRLSEADIPPQLLRRPDESLGDWRDRLWLQFRMPFVTAALDDVKTAYVEVVNPLLCRQVVEVVQSLPEKLRDNKTVFARIVSGMFPGVPFARRDAIQETDEILELAPVRQFLQQRLLASPPAPVLEPRVFALLATERGHHSTRSAIRRRVVVAVKRYAPRPIENYVRARLRRESPNPRRVAWRAFIIGEMSRMLAEDAGVGPVVRAER
jgi:hypothetical protein